MNSWEKSSRVLGCGHTELAIQDVITGYCYVLEQLANRGALARWEPARLQVVNIMLVG